MSNTMILYDIPTKGRCACFSPNVWKTRLVLNYKGIPYRTEWLSHPEIAPKLKATGIEPNPAGQGSPYTLPAIQLSDGNTIMESTTIAAKLESLHPNPPLHLDNGLVQKVGPIIGKASFPLIPVFMPRIGRDVIVEDSVEYFQTAREKRFGMTLDELEKTKGGEQAWEASRPGLVELSEFIAAQKQDEGPFILGSVGCYADFMIASMVEALRRIGGDLYEKFVETAPDDSVQKIHQACQKWMEKDQ
ncbi:uncharacterized protein LTR77_002976 [Saxophila tyrrhenica]|uniref:GST N-terminal domain-containing protein n=1 Tax=Saxophila tyrrhenica TaxID=1690608 RepID=A0AAV9PGN9_9PEZI|nr:hypothetical protein LTR77_002976 [Saxophila tyrrhenica]